MKNPKAIFRAFPMIAWILASMSLHAFGQESPTAKAARLLNESKMKFTKVEDGIWTIPFEGKQLKNFNVIVAADKTYLIIFAILPNQKQFRADSELLKKLLTHNDEFDKVKIGLDRDGNVSVRIDLSIRIVDRREFVESLDQTAAAADQVYGSIVPFLNAAK
jgi:hypothetical protein